MLTCSRLVFEVTAVKGIIKYARIEQIHLKGAWRFSPGTGCSELLFSEIAPPVALFLDSSLRFGEEVLPTAR